MDYQTQRLKTLEIVVAPWPIARSLSCHLGAGDLISLARASAGLRAVLHGFKKPIPLDSLQHEDLGVVQVSKRTVRQSLNIGFHDTLYWQRLKEEARFSCSSPTHTRGDKCRACRFCSKPICEACIVRSSFQRGKENTFNNRVRYFCAGCWDGGNITRSRRFPLSSTRRHSEWYSSSGTGDDHCICTLKNDGWLCLECKDRQNYEAATSEIKLCHGAGCKNPIGVHYERRRTCLWCQKTLPSPFGGASRHVWTQQMIDAKQRSIQALSTDIEEYNRLRLTTMRMTRREFRGEDAVKDDPEADKPQFVRHLDTMNYEHFMGHDSAPTGQQVYDSKRGYWRYNKKFLLRMRSRCCEVSPRADLTHIREGASEFVRTNAEKYEESKVYNSIVNIERRVDEDFTDEQKQRLCVKPGKSLPGVFGGNLWRHPAPEKRWRVEEWHALKSHILDAFFSQKLDMLQARVHLWHNYDFWAERAEFEIVLTVWGQNYSAIEQPILPTTLPERNILNMSNEDVAALAQEELEGHFDEESATRLFAEWEKADARMGDLADILNPPPADDESDGFMEDGIDQETIFKLLRSENVTGNKVDILALVERFGKDVDDASDPPGGAQGRSSSPKQEHEPGDKMNSQSYLGDLDRQIMGGLARYSPPTQRRENEGVEMTFGPGNTTETASAAQPERSTDRMTSEPDSDDSDDGR